jgi:endo-1,3-1,4-beta-glycanase ExoK
MQLPSSSSATLRVFGLTLLLVSGAAVSARAVGGSFADDLNSYVTSRWMKADGWTNGGEFNCGWRADHCNFSGGLMTLTLDNATCPSGCSGKPYASDEYRTTDVYGYGTYTVRMRAAKGSGIVSSFFIYNGSPWDEIDIEFLGKDTTKMQTNYFTNGVGRHESLISLGFDASAALHTYSIVWQPGSIKWYVDNNPVPVNTETGTRGPLPTHSGKIMMNLWPGIGVDSWLGPFTYTSPITAQYDSVQYTP